jgi:hypothetical protein
MGGCDGSSGYNRFKQRFSEKSHDDQYLFIISFVPIKLVSDNNIIIWQNPKTSSTRYCRPIKLLYAKETTILINEETKKIEEEIARLEPTMITVESEEIPVHQELLMTSELIALLKDPPYPI